MKKLSVFLLVFVVLAIFSYAEQLKVTSEHPFYLDGEWVEAKDLKPGDKLKTIDGKTAVIKDIQKVETEEPITVYNLEDDFYLHNYVVDKGLVVHNSNVPKTRVCEACIIRCTEHQGGCGGVPPGFLKKGQVLVYPDKSKAYLLLEDPMNGKLHVLELGPKNKVFFEGKVWKIKQINPDKKALLKRGWVSTEKREVEFSKFAEDTLKKFYKWEDIDYNNIKWVDPNDIAPGQFAAANSVIPRISAKGIKTTNYVLRKGKKVLVFSDIHGSVDDLNTLEQVIRQGDFDDVIALGDWDHHADGPVIDRMLQIVRDNPRVKFHLKVQGNHDASYVTRLGFSSKTSEQNTGLSNTRDFLRELNTPEGAQARAFYKLQEPKPMLYDLEDGHRLLAVHGLFNDRGIDHRWARILELKPNGKHTMSVKGSFEAMETIAARIQVRGNDHMGAVFFRFKQGGKHVIAKLQQFTTYSVDLNQRQAIVSVPRLKDGYAVLELGQGCGQVKMALKRLPQP